MTRAALWMGEGGEGEEGGLQRTSALFALQRSLQRIPPSIPWQGQVASADRRIDSGLITISRISLAGWVKVKSSSPPTARQTHLE